ncbi:MAG TPA: hypothetical protein DEQ98_05535, partial [Acidobacteria bacterium]|nr:hypothetical protein [Acidobacteriota bacterium]
LSDYPNVVVYPRGGANPVDNDDRADYYDTLHYGAGIVGINTSAMIEAGIQDRPVFTIVDSSFDDTQTGTLHFRYLLPENGGHLQHATSLDEHTRQLSATLDDGLAPSAQMFTKTFVRPHGLDVAATPRLVAALEALADTTPRGSVTLPPHLWPLRAGLWTLAVLLLAGDRKRLRQRWHHYSMAAWHYYKTRRKPVRKWRQRLEKVARKTRKRSGAGGAVL